MDSAIVRDVLLDNKYISEVEIKQNEVFQGKSYNFIIRCKLDVLDKWIPIVIGIPPNWSLYLFDFYMVGEKPFIPHVEKSGKLCLFNLEGRLLYPDFSGLLNQCILKAKAVISDGYLEKNKVDFIKEFDAYFCLFKDEAIANVVVPLEKKHMRISFCEKANQNKITANTRYLASIKQSDFLIWGYHGTQRNGIYFYIDPPQYIYPPNFRDSKPEDFLNILLSYVDCKSFEKLIRKCSNQLALFFTILQDESTVSSCGFVVENPKFLMGNSVELVEFSKLIPLSIQRVDREYLSSRTSFLSDTLASKSILLIGCGSIGGYVFHNLIKSGVKEITIIDNDVMKSENIFRHFLGVESVNAYKTDALANYANKTLPDLNVKVISAPIEKLIMDSVLDLNEYDYIVSAIGNHTVNCWLDRYILEHNIFKTTFYLWNEPLDIGCHVARVNIKDEGDYSNLFGIVNDEVIDWSSYVKAGQTFATSYSGCNGTFIPYGSTLSVENSVMFMDLLKREADERIGKNLIVSKKGDDYYLKAAGYFVSDRYIEQVEKYVEVVLSDL